MKTTLPAKNIHLAKGKLVSWQNTPDPGDTHAVRHGGRKVNVVVVNVSGGYYKPGLGYESVLCRALDGSAYYLAHEIDADRLKERGEPPVRLRLPWMRVKRLSVRTAMLYVLNWGTSRVVRQDFAALCPPQPTRKITTVAFELDEQASAVALEYAALTGADPRDVVNAAVTDTTTNAVEQLRPGASYRDDSLGIVAAHVAAAARRRRGEDAPDAEVNLPPLPEDHAGPLLDPGAPVLPEGKEGEGSHRSAGADNAEANVICFELSPQAFALMEVTRIHDGYGTAEEFVRATMADTVQSLMESYSHEDGELRQVFGVADEGSDEAEE